MLVKLACQAAPEIANLERKNWQERKVGNGFMAASHQDQLYHAGEAGGVAA